MLLSVAVVSPEVHAWLHEPEHESAHHACAHQAGPAAHGTAPAPDSDSHDAEIDRCAVTLFSHGVLSQAVTLLVQPCEGILRAVNHRAFEQLALARPRFLHRPPQAPPAA